MRHVAAGIAACIALVTVVACGGDDSGDQPVSTSAKTSVETTAATSTDSTAPTSSDAEQTTIPAPVEVEKVRVTTTGSGTLLTLPQLVAEEQGIYEANGLEVSLVQAAGGPAAVQALLSGDADIMLNSPDFVLQATDKGQAVQYVVGNTVRGIITVVVANDWPTPNAGDYPASIGDLKGAKIGVVARGAIVENQLRLMLEDAGLDPDSDVTIVPTGLLDTAIPALETGQVDAWVGFEPGTSIVLNERKIAKSVVDVRNGEGPDAIVNYPTNGYAAKTDYIADHPEVIERFVASMVDAQEWIADPANRAALEQLVVEKLNVDAALAPSLLDDNLATFGATVPETAIANAIALVTRAGLITSDITYADVVATEFVPKG